MRKKIISCFCLVAFAVLMIGITSSHSNATLASEIEENFTRMSNLSVDQMISSNPYDYINCEYYNNIVSMGIPALKVLEENYHNGVYQGLNAYIAALAIQDISGMNLYECTGCDWENSAQFFEEWDNTMQNLSDIFEKIINSDDTVANKIQQIENYGAFGQAFLCEIRNKENYTFEFSGKKIVVEEKIKLDNVSDISEEECAKVDEYLDYVMKISYNSNGGFDAYDMSYGLLWRKTGRNSERNTG